MPNSRYFIVQKEDNWLIRYGEDDFGPYATRQEALLFAVDAAQRQGERGTNTEVCLLGENGRFVPQWAYGRDTYPPRL